MSRSIKGAKGPGYEYWTNRPGNRLGANRPTSGKWGKKRTHRLERLINRSIVREEKKSA